MTKIVGYAHGSLAFVEDNPARARQELFCDANPPPDSVSTAQFYVNFVFAACELWFCRDACVFINAYFHVFVGNVWSIPRAKPGKKCPRLLGVERDVELGRPNPCPVPWTRLDLA